MSTIHSLSLGAGVQSTTLYMMNATQDPRLGEVLPDGKFAELAIFADPGDEGQETYAHLWRLAEWGSGRVPDFDERQLDLWGEFAGECEGMCGV